jgi:hypothetical protein
MRGSINPGLLGGAPPATTTTKLFNFRSTLAGNGGTTVDGAGQTPVLASTPAYSGAQGFGYDGGNGPGATADDAGYTDPRIAGAHNWTNISSIFRSDLANGNYKLDLAEGFDFGGFHQSLAIWDGYCGLTAQANTAAAMLGQWASGEAGILLTNGAAYRISGNRLYKAQTAGTCGAVAPTHTSGTVSDGGVDWLYVKTAIFALDVSPANHFVDGAGNSWDKTLWTANHALSAAFAVSQGFVSITKLVAANYGRVRHIGLIGQ